MPASRHTTKSKPAVRAGAARRTGRPANLRLEALEDRALMAANITASLLPDGTVQIEGQYARRASPGPNRPCRADGVRVTRVRAAPLPGRRPAVRARPRHPSRRRGAPGRAGRSGRPRRAPAGPRARHTGEPRRPLARAAWTGDQANEGGADAAGSRQRRLGREAGARAVNYPQAASAPMFIP